MSNDCVYTDWHSCYNESWQGLLVPAAFAHPAKMSPALLKRIVTTGIERGYWKAGDIVADPFGGIGSTGIICAYYGLQTISVELEGRFVALAQENFDLHRHKWETLGAPMPYIVQGDSRKFAEFCKSGMAAMRSSPPYADSFDTAPDDPDNPRLSKSARAKLSKSDLAGRMYGSTEGQIGAMKEGSLTAAISSPPYAETGVAGGGDNIDRSCIGTGKDLHGSKARDYGTTEGQIGSLKEGSLTAAMKSPPFVDSLSGKGACPETRPDGTAFGQGKSIDLADYGTTDGQIGALKEGMLGGVISSPPYADQNDHERPLDSTRNRNGRAAISEPYGLTDGQIGSLPAGDLSGVVRSPPFEESTAHDPRPCKQTVEYQEKYGHKHLHGTYGGTDGQIGNETADTYWQAVAQVYSQVHLALRPKGIIVLVVKDYIKKGKVVPLCDQTCQLLKSLGFTVFERTRAWLVKETTEPGLFGPITTIKKHASFFRRLAEARGSPKIDFEQVIWARR